MTDNNAPDDLAARFTPDYTPEQLENLGVYDALYRGQGPRLASLGEWKPEWISEHDPKGWAQWYKRYVAGRRLPDEDNRQIKRWLSFKARHGGPFAKNPTPRRGWALRNWAIDPTTLVSPEEQQRVAEMLDAYKTKATQKHLAQKQSSSAHILVSGHSGAGKSTLAKALAEKLHMPYAQVDKRPEFTEFLANNTPENHLLAGSPKHEEFRRLLRATALKTLDDVKEPSIIEGSQLAYLSPDVLAKFKRIHVNPSLRQAYQQRLSRTKQRYLKDPTKQWTPEVEEEKRRTADMVYAFHRPAFREYDKLPGTLKYKPDQNIDRLIRRLQKTAEIAPDVQLQPATLVAPEQANNVAEMLDEYQRKAMQKHIADKQAVDNTAVIIRGNPKFITDNPAAEAFYAKLQKYMEQQGYAVTQDAGEPNTMPPAANVWLGHSRGVDRFRFAPEGTRTIGLGAPDGINHPDDTAMKPGDVPTAAHYKLTPEMLAALSAKLQKQADLLPGKAMQQHLKQSAQVATQEEIFDAVRPFIPGKPLLASGGLPDVIGISDVDIGLHTKRYKDLLAQLPAGTQAQHADTHSYYSIPGYDREVNVFATPDKDLARRGAKHRAIQLLLREKYPHLAERARQHKAKGLGTEPAWAKVLQLAGDPYEAMLDKQKALSAAQLLKQSANSAGGKSERQFGRNKQADLIPDLQLQEHQQRVADRIAGDDPRLLVYHGLGTGKSLASIAAAEKAKAHDGSEYGVVVPASLRGNFQKEIKKFTRGSNPEVMSYTGLGLGKKFTTPPDTLIMDEAARLRNPQAASTRAAMQAAMQARRLLLLTGTPITNSPGDLASLVSMLNDKYITPKDFEDKFVGNKTVRPGLLGWLRGAKPGAVPYVKNEDELRKLLAGKVDYQPGKTPEGVNVNEEVVRVPLSDEQQKIQQAIRTKIPPGFLWKLDQEFPLSKDELSRLNSFLTGLRQVSLSTQPFRADKDPLKAFDQSSKLRTAFDNLKTKFESDPRKKALIYSNFIDAGLRPYAAALERAQIPHAFFHGGVSPKVRQAAVDAYNAGKLRALLIGPAGAEGISTKGTSLIQLLDPHWNEARSQQAKGRGLRFDSHRDLPEELKSVAVQRYLAQSEEPGFWGKWLGGKKRQRTADEVLERLTAEKEQFNDTFRKVLQEVGTMPTKQSSYDTRPFAFGTKMASGPGKTMSALLNTPAGQAWQRTQFRQLQSQ